MTHPDRIRSDSIPSQLGRLSPAWDGEPVPLSARRLLPPFPTDALSPWLADMVAAVAEFTQTPPDLAGCLSLACLATAAGGRVVVEVRPGWREPVNLFTVVALPPGARKSPVFATMVGPLIAAEQILQETAAPARARAEVEAKAARAHALEAEKIAENTYATEHGAKAIADAGAAKNAADDLVVPPKPRLIADDVTPEEAASLLARHGGRLALLSSEGGIFNTIAGRYSGTPNLEVFLKGHAGDHLIVDRKSRDHEYIERPALTLGLAVQPEILTDIAAMPGFRGRGLLARILYAIPTSTVGRRRIGTPSPAEHVTEAYTATLRSLVINLADWTDPAPIVLTPTANEAVLHLEETLEPRLHPDHGDLAPIADWASKYIGAIVRIAGLLHIAADPQHGWKHPITADTIAAAGRLGTYYLGHALAVFDLMGADPMVDNARHVLDWINRTGARQFTRRDLYRAMPRGRFPKVPDLDPVLDVLIAHGHIRPTPIDRPGTSGGRPASPVYDVHPRVTELPQLTQPQDKR
jgi:replicative DNA helicase